VTTVSLPVTVKLRSGWYKYQWIDGEFARCAEDCGVAAVVLHPRSQTMGFSGHSFWERIATVKKELSIPVIGNGDITGGNDAVEMKKQTGCDAIMVGRAALGNPWIFSEVKAALYGETTASPTIQKRIDTALRHINEYRERYGEYRASREMKKHLAWYIKGMEGASQLRNRIFRARGTATLENVLKEAFVQK
jgi:nifR3 family TIM-barrel protein